jgi:hypothetical protein
MSKMSDKDKIVRVRRERKMTVQIRVVAIAALATLPFAGCTGDDGSKSPSQPSQATAKYTQPAGAITDLSNFHCSASADGIWSAEGTLTNATSAPRTYDVTVAVAKRNSSEVLGMKQISRTVKAGKKLTFKVAAVHKGASTSAQCVPVVTLRVK